MLGSSESDLSKNISITVLGAVGSMTRRKPSSLESW